MSRFPTDDSGRNGFFGLAASGKLRLTSKLIAKHNKKAVSSALLVRDTKGRTPAHIAAYCGHIRTLMVLLNACPEAKYLRDSQGNTVVDALRRPDGVEDATDAKLKFRRLVTWGSNLNGQLSQDIEHDSAVDDHHKIPLGHCAGELNVLDSVVKVSLGANTMAVVSHNTNNGSLLIAGQNRTDGLLTDLNKSSEISELDVADWIIDVATAAKHTITVSESSCWSWGARENGVLGYHCDTKHQKTPKRLDASSFPSFQSDQELKLNKFEALAYDQDQSRQVRKPKRAFKGCDTCFSHTVVYTCQSLWAWGLNNCGQMLGKVGHGEITEEPLLIIESWKDQNDSIAEVRCSTDWGIVVRTVNGCVDVLANDKIVRLFDPIHDNYGSRVLKIQTDGPYLVAQVGKDRLIRYVSKHGTLINETVKVWTAKRAKDHIRSFDVASTGEIILSTVGGVYHWESPGNLSLMQSISGIPLSTVVCDSQFRSFAGIYEFTAPNHYFFEPKLVINPVVPLPDQQTVVTIHGDDVSVESVSDLTLQCGDHESLKTSTALILGRCPALRTQVKDGVIQFSQMTLSQVKAFDSACRIDDWQPSVRGLEPYIRKNLRSGLWSAAEEQIGTDVIIKCHGKLLHAHSWIVKQRSRFFQARLDPAWTKRDQETEGPVTLELDANYDVMKNVLRFLYTGRITRFAGKQGPGNVPRLKEIQFLCDTMELGEKMVIDDELQRSCVSELMLSLDFELLLPLFVFSGLRGYLHDLLLQVIVKHMDFFMFELEDHDGHTQDIVEKAFRSLDHTLSFSQSEKAELLSLLDEQLVASRMSSPSSSTHLPISAKSESRSDTKARAKSNAISFQATTSQTYETRETLPVVPSIVSVANNSVRVKESSGKSSTWVPVRRKSRPSSSRPTVVQEATPVPSVSPSLRSLSSSPDPSTPSRNSSLVSLASSPSPVTPLTPNQPAVSSITPPAWKKLTPNLGELPSLGASKPKTSRASSSSKSSRPKLSQKERRKCEMNESPFSDALQDDLARPLGGTSTGTGSPWKVVEPQTSSRAVLEHLERRKPLHFRQGGPVWGGNLS